MDTAKIDLASHEKGNITVPYFKTLIQVHCHLDDCANVRFEANYESIGMRLINYIGIYNLKSLIM